MRGTATAGLRSTVAYEFRIFIILHFTILHYFMLFLISIIFTLPSVSDAYEVRLINEYESYAWFSAHFNPVTTSYLETG